MSEGGSELYVIELDGDGGDATTIRRLLQCTYSKGGALDVSRRDITAMRRLVRCKGCRHADVRGRWLLCDLSTYREVEPDGFCSWAEKRPQACVSSAMHWGRGLVSDVVSVVLFAGLVLFLAFVTWCWMWPR